MRLAQRLRRVWTASIARQLLLGISLVHAALMTFFVMDLVDRQDTFLVRQSTAQAQALARVLAANGTSWVLSSDYVGIEEVIASQSHFPGLRYALFADLHGKVLGYTDRSQVGRFADDDISHRLLDARPESQVLVDRPTFVDVAYPIVAGDRHIGWARVGISREQLVSNRSVVTQKGAIYTVLAILLGVVFAAAMARGLTRDIRALGAFAVRIRDGARGGTAGVDRDDELGALAADMDRMLADLEDRESDLRAAHARIAQNEERLRFALEGASDGLWDWDIETDQTYFSPRWKAMLGYAEDELADVFGTWASLVHPDDLPGAQAAVQAHLESPDLPYEVLLRMRHRDGSWRWILTRGQALPSGDGPARRMVGTHVDLTVQKRLEHTLVAEREKAQVTLHSIADGVITTDAQGQVEYLNPVAEALTGWSADEALGRTLSEVFPQLDEATGARLPDPVSPCLRAQAPVRADEDTLLRHRRGHTVAITDSVAPIRDAAGEVTGAVLVFQDVTAARSLQRELEYQATHDALTGLWSRRAFDARLETINVAVRKGERRHVLVYVDLDQFKVVNDTAGHLAGDELLKQVAGLLQRGLRSNDLLARLGGDEFGLLLVDCALPLAQGICERLRLALAEFRFAWKQQVFQIGASFGLVVLDETVAEPNVLSLADLACYSAKEAGRNRAHVYRPDDAALAARRSEMHWVSRIQAALADDRLLLYGQRILDLRTPTPGLRLEVLLRMRSLDGGMALPGQFIPAAERYDLMPQIDLWVVRNALDWLVEHPEVVELSINLSGMSLGHADLLETIEHRLDLERSLRGRVCFEVTETAAITNLHAAVGFMERLTGQGARFALDDFGSGLSSFGYLKSLPVSRVKIDGSFVRDLIDDPVDAAVVESIARIAGTLGIATVAEFVSSAVLLERVTAMGIDFAQGFYIDRPHPLSEGPVEVPEPGQA